MTGPLEQDHADRIGKDTVILRQVPSPGRIVLYRLKELDVTQINARRDKAAATRGYPGGVRHFGNAVSAGDVYPMIVTRGWFPPDQYMPGTKCVNGQVFLDGNATLWVSSVLEGPGHGMFAFPPHVPPVAVPVASE